MISRTSPDTGPVYVLQEYETGDTWSAYVWNANIEKTATTTICKRGEREKTRKSVYILYVFCGYLKKKKKGVFIINYYCNSAKNDDDIFRRLTCRTKIISYEMKNCIVVYVRRSICERNDVLTGTIVIAVMVR